MRRGGMRDRPPGAPRTVVRLRFPSWWRQPVSGPASSPSALPDHCAQVWPRAVTSMACPDLSAVGGDRPAGSPHAPRSTWPAFSSPTPRSLVAPARRDQGGQAPLNTRCWANRLAFPLLNAKFTCCVIACTSTNPIGVAPPPKAVFATVRKLRTEVLLRNAAVPVKLHRVRSPKYNPVVPSVCPASAKQCWA